MMHEIQTISGSLFVVFQGQYANMQEIKQNGPESLEHVEEILGLSQQQQNNSMYKSEFRISWNVDDKRDKATGYLLC